MLRKSLALKIFEAFSIQRWNDKIRPVELTEMDKHAHKMIIAYCLGKYEEQEKREVQWERIIEGGIFELLRRVVTSDIKSPVYRRIKLSHPEVFREFNTWVYKQLEPLLDGLPGQIKEHLKEYLFGSEDDDHDLVRKILGASHTYASFWEFQILWQAHPNGYQMKEIDRNMHNNIESYLDLAGMRRIMCKGNISNFIDLCGQLRFQIRWSQTPRLPRTSVLGHMLMVAIFTFLFSKEVDACSKRVYNNFFGALFHDLPEVVTRDILSPIKRAVEGMPGVISKIEDELAEEEIFPLLEEDWKKEIKYFTKDEFKGKIQLTGTTRIVSSKEINEGFNENSYNPLDGEYIKIADDLSAYLEAYVSDLSGIGSRTLKDSMKGIEDKYQGETRAGIPIGSLYADFM
jgi:putative hydrolase of HD superfamily